jgi:hypothetical protein
MDKIDKQAFVEKALKYESSIDPGHRAIMLALLALVEGVERLSEILTTGICKPAPDPDSDAPE